MEWKGEQLRSPQDFVNAIYGIDDPDEAQAFKELWASEWENAERDIGYLTGYMPEDVGEAKRMLFGVEHPIIGDLERPFTADDLMVLGMEFMKAQTEGLDFDAAAAKARESVRFLRAHGTANWQMHYGNGGP